MTWNTDIQANILRGLPARQARYLFLRVDSRKHLRDLIRTALPFTRTAAWQRDRFPRGTQTMDHAVLNLAFTRRGLSRATGVGYVSDERRRGAVNGTAQDADAFAYRYRVPTSDAAGSVSLDPFARNSMYRRLDLLGEGPIVEDAQPGGGPPTLAHSWSWDPKQSIHVLAWISGPNAASIKSIELPLRSHPGVSVVHAISGLVNPRHIDPFGFADGVNQPAVEGFHGRAEMFGRGAWTSDGWRGLKPGEFVTGEEDEGGEIRRPEPSAVLHNSTYLVFRQIRMWPERLTNLLDSHEAATGLPADEIASWLVGRHRPGNGNEGTSLMIEGPSEDPDFVYGHDPEGVRCPLGAHIRRANPRDAMSKDGARSNRHRIIRRGMPYYSVKGFEFEQGLAFIGLQARIEDQFEFVQAHWLNRGPTLHVGEDPDAIAGNGAPDVLTPRFVRQGSPETVLALERPDPFGKPLTAVRGGEYFVMPPLAGLQELAEF